MKKIFFVLLICSVGHFVAAQNNYKQFYLEIYNARKQAFENKKDSAVYTYFKTFNLVDYIPIKILSDAYNLAEQQKNDSLLNHCSQRIDSYFQSERLTHNFIPILDSLFNIDQKIRFDTTLTAYEKQEIDSSNINLLYSLILKYGFPSEKLIGVDAYQITILLLIHNDGDIEFQKIQPIYKTALLNGGIHPEDYAWLIDRFYTGELNEPPYYYFIPFGINELSKNKINIINQRRKLIGLRPLFEGEKFEMKNGVLSRTILF